MLLALLTFLPAAPAAADGASPLIQTVLDGPAQPFAGVHVALAVSIAPELLLTVTSGPGVEVLDAHGAPFLRIGPAGVQANLDDPAYYSSLEPFAAAPVPPGAAYGARARFVTVSSQPSWGWFDQRLQLPVTPAAGPSAPPGGRLLMSWAVPLRSATGRVVAVRGQVRLEPLLGHFVARLSGPPPAGLSVQVLGANDPGLFVTLTGPGPVTLLGAQGEPLFRFSRRAGVEVNLRSPTWLSIARVLRDRLPTGVDARAAPRWARLSVSPTLSWIDPRLIYPAPLPPRAILDRATPSVAARWAIPVLGGPALTGVIDWIPVDDAAAAAAAAVAVPSAAPFRARPDRALPAALGAGALLVLGALTGFEWRRRRRRAGAP